MDAVKLPKEGDFVVSRIEQYDIKAGKKYRVVSRVDSLIYVTDDAGESYPLLSGEYSLLDSAPGGATAYYDLPEGATTLNDLIEHKDMSFALGNIFKACYRYGEKDSASKIYDLNKIIYFAERLKAIEEKKNA